MKTSPTKRRAARLALLCLLLLPFASCRQTPDAGTNANTSHTFTREKTTGARGGTLTYRVNEPPKSLNALMASSEPSFLVAFFLTGGRLLEFDHDSQRYVGGLAETWRLQPDGSTVDLTLRDGLKFSDGQPITTADLDFTLRAIYDERTKSFFRSALLVGDNKPIAVKVVDERRAQLVFPEPVAAPESFLVNVAVVPRHALQTAFDAGTLGEAYAVTADPKTVVTAGAFMFDQVTPGERFVLKRNPHFWKKDSAGTQLPYLDSVVVEVVPDSNAALARLREGGLDVVDRIRPTDYAAIQSQPGRVRAVDLGPGLTSDHMWFNLNEGEVEGRPKANPTKQAWFRDERFRRAVSHAIDRESIARGTLQGLATPLYNFVPPSNRNWGATDIPRTDFNRERALALLREAGFQSRGGADAPELFDAQGNRVEFTIITSQESEPRKSMAAAIQEDLAKVGIRVQVAPVETGELRRRFQQTFDYEAVLFGITVSDFDPSSYSNLLVSSGTEHQWHPKQAKPATPWEARIDELVAEVAREADEGRRRAAFREIQVLMGEHLPVIPLFARHITCAANQRIGNYRPSPLVPFSMWNAEELFVRQ